jgi:hypothetical protein
MEVDMSEYVESIYITCILLLYVVGGYYIVNKTVDLLTIYTDIAANKIRKIILFKSLPVPQWAILGLEVLGLAFSIWFSCRSEISSTHWFLFWLCIIVLRIINRCLRGYLKDYFSIFEWFARIIDVKNYFCYSIRSLFIEVLDLIYNVGLALFFTYSILTLRWPMPMYYFIFIALPLYLNFWIYLLFTSWFGIKIRTDESVINIRRLIAYCILAGFALSDNYSKFEGLTSSGETKIDGWSLFLLSSGVIFTALERVFKAGMDHYQGYFQSNIKK